MTTTAPAVTATRIATRASARFMFDLFGTYFMYGESALFTLARSMAPDQYDGGQWTFFQLSNAGLFAVPPGPDEFELEAENGNRRAMTREAAGVTLTLFALGRMMERAYEANAQASLALLNARHERLSDYARTLPDWSAIRAVVD